jgi:hypothetical protein
MARRELTEDEAAEMAIFERRLAELYPNPPDEEVRKLDLGARKVFMLMANGHWHHPDNICMAAGSKGEPHKEGLRRMRQLRILFSIEKTRPEGTSIFWYRLARRELVSKTGL